MGRSTGNRFQDSALHSIGGGQAGSSDSQAGFGASLRSASANRTGSEFRPPVPTWSKNVGAYTNKALTGVTDYQFNYGEKVGHCPKPHILDEHSTHQPRIYNPLK